jgi:hypothetical protein
LAITNGAAAADFMHVLLPEGTETGLDGRLATTAYACVYPSSRFLGPSLAPFGFSVVRLWRLVRFSAAFNLRNISRWSRIDDDCLCPPITVPSDRRAATT